MDREIKLFCQGCGHRFTTGEKMFIFKLGIVNKELCDKCRVKVTEYVQSLSKEDPHQTIPF